MFRSYAMRHRYAFVILFLALLITSPCHAGAAGNSVADSGGVPDGFVRVTDMAPDVLLDIRYYSAFNFVGARVDGYLAPVAVLSRPAALALAQAATAARDQGFVLRVFDAYRPQGRWVTSFAGRRMPRIRRTRLSFIRTLTSRGSSH